MSNDAIPQTALEAESFLWHALKHIGDGLIFYRMPRARAAACTVIREAISQMQEQQHDEQLVGTIPAVTRICSSHRSHRRTACRSWSL